MKKILLIITIMGLAASGYSQDKSCACTKKPAAKVVHHKKMKQTVAKVQPAQAIYVEPLTIQPVAVPATARVKTCAIDQYGNMEYGVATTYTGNYPADADCDIYDSYETTFPELQVTSTAFKNNGVLPAKYTCTGQNVNPPLNVTNVPQGTVSLAVVMVDQHATENKSANYWLIWNIDSTGVIPENFRSDYSTENPISKIYGYQGACPVSGTHDYHFRVYALDTKVQLDRNGNQAMLESAIRGHVLAKGEIVAQYNRHLD
jgi:Raf kinase inhibitor-like YbhB/YbcL family protein